MRELLPLVGMLVTVPVSGLAAQEQAEYGQFAPEDAYSDGSPWAYYGSENEWDRRFFSEREADRFPKRRGQRQLLAILEDRPDEAVAMCRRRLEQDPGDEETLFVLTVAQTQLGELDAALATARRALDAGLPFGRLVAGPRELLRPLRDTAGFRALAVARGEAIVHGPLLGAVTDHSARVWVRTAVEGGVRVRAYPPGDPVVSIDTAEVRSLAALDYTAVVDLKDLAHATGYVYEVLVDGMVVTERFPLRTFPAVAVPGSFRIAFGGGAGYNPEHERIWRTIADRDPTALLLLGDNVYVDLPGPPGPFHRYTYYRRQSRPELRSLVRSTPVFAIWDDHDAAIDDVWLGPYVDRPAWKRPGLALFLQNWNNPAPADASWPGVWFRFAIGDVDFFMLDGRSYRTNPFGPEPSMLGPVQKAWLLDGLRRSQATFKVIVSPVPWELGAKPGSRDTWNGFRTEREEIFGFLSDQRIEGVLLLSADRHRSDAWRIPRAGDYPLYELSSSHLTNLHRHEPVPGSLFSYNRTCAFGLVSFDTTHADPVATYEVVSIDGEVVERLEIARSELRSETPSARLRSTAP